MTEAFRQKERGLMVYPARGWRRLMFRSPLFWWRLGFRPILGRLFLLLTTKGRTTGQPRHVMLEYALLNGNIYISPGWGERTQWYQNLLADGRVTVQTADKTLVANAVRVTDDQELASIYHAIRGKSAVWKEWLESWGVRDDVEDFVAKKDRLCTLRLEPAEGPGPKPLGADLI
jgi:deazaflavin-dependent oxidoreductase (nitroreductase family)